LLNRFLLRKRFLIAKEKKFNARFRFKAEDCVGRTIYKHGTYEPEITHFLLSHLAFQPDDLIIDIGANIGWYTIMLATCFPHTQLLAFEPDNFNYSLLQGNIKRNHINNVITYQKALAEETGTKTLYQYKSANLGRHSLLPIYEGNTLTIDAIRLDQLIENGKINPELVKFIKIDIEGYEYFALSGAKTLLQQTPLILSEFSPDYMRKAKIPPQQYLDLMYQYNYQPYGLHQNALRPLDEAQLQAETNTVMDIFWQKN
jgi:FkbM family methyltransferase